MFVGLISGPIKVRHTGYIPSFFAEELTCELQQQPPHQHGGGRNHPGNSPANNATNMVHMGPPTSTSSSRANGCELGGNPPTTKPTLTGWSTDDERIFEKEAAKISLKWLAKLNKSTKDFNKELYVTFQIIGLCMQSQLFDSTTLCD